MTEEKNVTETISLTIGTEISKAGGTLANQPKILAGPSQTTLWC